jgi:hypothetical protein
LLRSIIRRIIMLVLLCLLRSRNHLLLDLLSNLLLRRISMLRSSMVLLGLLLWDMRLDMRLTLLRWLNRSRMNLLRWLNRSRMMLLLDLLLRSRNDLWMLNMLLRSRNDLWMLNLLWRLNRSRMMVLLNLLLWWRLHKSSKIVMLWTWLM